MSRRLLPSRTSPSSLFVTNTARHSVHSWRSILVRTLREGGLCDGSGTRQRRNNRSKNIQFSFFSSHDEAVHQRAPHSYIGVIVHADLFELDSTRRVLHLHTTANPAVDRCERKSTWKNSMFPCYEYDTTLKWNHCLERFARKTPSRFLRPTRLLLLPGIRILLTIFPRVFPNKLTFAM